MQETAIEIRCELDSRVWDRWRIGDGLIGGVHEPMNSRLVNLVIDSSEMCEILKGTNLVVLRKGNRGRGMLWFEELIDSRDHEAACVRIMNRGRNLVLRMSID